MTLDIQYPEFGQNEGSLDPYHKDFYQNLRSRIRVWSKRRGKSDRKWSEFLMFAPDLFHLLCKLSIDSEVPARPVLNTLALALMARAGGNRWQEPLVIRSVDLVRTLASYLGLGILSQAMGNQATRCIVPLGIRIVDEGNQELIELLAGFVDEEIRCPDMKQMKIWPKMAGTAYLKETSG